MTGVIGYQGIPGNYSHSALSTNYKTCETQGFPTFTALFEALKNGKIASLAIPVENSSVGGLRSMALLLKNDFRITAQFEAIESHFICLPEGTPIDHMTHVYAHPFVLDQCSDWLESLTNVTVVQSTDSAQACHTIKECNLKNHGVIASPSCAKHYGLTPISNVANVNETITRYFLVSKTATKVERHDNPTTILVASLKNTCGALTRAAACFSFRDLNISKIESQPSTRSIQASKPWEYNIHLQVDAGVDEDRMKCAIGNLEEFGTVRILGCFPVSHVVTPIATGVFGIGL